MLNFFNSADIKHGQYVFDIPTVANSIGVSAVDISNMLQMLKVWESIHNIPLQCLCHEFIFIFPEVSVLDDLLYSSILYLCCSMITVAGENEIRPG